MRARISGLPGSRICDGLPGCLPPVRIGLVRPAHGDFYFQAFNGSVALPVAGYNYNSDWTPLLAGLSPAGMAASLAAPEPYVRLSRIRLPSRVCDGKTFCMTSRAPSPGTRSVASSSSKWPARIANLLLFGSLSISLGFHILWKGNSAIADHALPESLMACV